MRPFDPALTASYPAVVGCDEVGRGSLCGPVVVAATWFDPTQVPDALILGLDDSKRLSARARHRMEALILEYAQVAVAARSARFIDRWGIRVATLDAMRSVSHRLAHLGPVVFDGVDVPDQAPAHARAQVRGDSTVPQIAAASIVAKELRDRLMAGLSGRYPAYGWAENAGYGTRLHVTAITQFGATGHHRMSFAPMAPSKRISTRVPAEKRPL